MKYRLIAALMALALLCAAPALAEEITEAEIPEAQAVEAEASSPEAPVPEIVVEIEGDAVPPENDSELYQICPHDGAVFENTWVEDEHYSFINATAHEYAAAHCTRRCCAACGEPVSNVEVTRVSETQPHRFVDGCCADCGYVNLCGDACTHPAEDIVQLLPEEREEYAPYSDAEHIVRRVRVTETLCMACGCTLFEAIEIQGEYPAAHGLVNGVCAECGCAPGVKAKNFEAGFAPRKRDDRVNGVAVDDGLNIVEACARVGDSLQDALDAGVVSVEIANLSEVFTGDELERLAELPLREQLLTAQCFLGFRADVVEAVRANAALLGNPARTLIDSVQRRIDAMSADEREAFKDTLAARFPMTALEVAPGTTTEVFNIDLNIRGVGNAVCDRYSFQNTGSSWNLVGISSR